MTLLGYCWFNSNIGIVLTINSVKEIKAYIATVSGLNEYEDLSYIMERGSAFPVAEAKSLIKNTGFITENNFNYFI